MYERQREERAARLRNDALFLQAEQDRANALHEAREAEWVTGVHPCTTYRPDETDTFRDLNEERDWERSAAEWERFG